MIDLRWLLLVSLAGCTSRGAEVLVDGTPAGVTTPSTSPRLQIVAGLMQTCALQDGEVYCWGSNGEGALGGGTTSTRLVPVPVAGLGPVAALAAGEQQSCALAVTGEVRCWGRDLRALDVPRAWDVARTPAVVVGLPTR